MKRFYKVLLGTESSAAPGFHYNVDEVTVAHHWNPEATHPRVMGGFSIATDAALIRWIFRGNILYDVTIPEDAEVVYPEREPVTGELARVNKVILSNPRPMTDELAMQFYKASKFTSKEDYYRILAGCAICGYEKTCREILKDHLTPETAQECLDVWKLFVKPDDYNHPFSPKLYLSIRKVLCILSDESNATTKIPKNR